MQNKNKLIFNLTISEFQKLIDERIIRVFEYYNAQKYSDQASFNEIINIDEACKLLNLAKQTVYGLVSNRKIPFIKKGKKLRFEKTKLINYLESGRKKTAAEIQDDANSFLCKSIHNNKNK